MNDEILAQQLSETGDLLDLLSNDIWMGEIEAVEAESRSPSIFRSDWAMVKICQDV